jgi:hypothetical protein
MCARRTGGWTPLMRFRLFPSAFAGRAVPSGRCRLHGPSRSDVSPAWAPTLSAGPSPRFFVASRLDSFLAYLETPPARVIRGRVSFAHVPGPHPGLLSRPGRVSYTRRRSWDLSFPSQCSSDLRAVTPHRHHRAHLPFRLPLTASFVVAGPDRLKSAMGGAAAASGLRALPQASRAVSSADPAMAFMHRVVRTHRPGLPWDFAFLSQVFGVAPPVSTSEDHSTRASRTATRDVAAAMNVAKRRPCPSALSGAVA